MSHKRIADGEKIFQCIPVRFGMGDEDLGLTATGRDLGEVESFLSGFGVKKLDHLQTCTA